MGIITIILWILGIWYGFGAVTVFALQAIDQDQSFMFKEHLNLVNLGPILTTLLIIAIVKQGRETKGRRQRR